MEIKLDEVEWFGAVSTVGGVAIFIVACFWDSIVGVHVAHNEGYGLAQILVMAISGIYSGWSLSINRKWHEYIKRIHGLNE